MTMKTGHLHLNDSAAQQGRRVANLESPKSSHEIWYETGSRPLSIASGADPFLAGSILHWMKLGVDLHVHGSVSRTLLQGLSEWQQAWSRWRPDLYRLIDISADEIRDDVPTGENAIAAFSGGVDAAYTVHRHVTGAAGWQTAPLRAALLVHGFDIPLADTGAFERATARAERMLDGLGLELVTVATNVQRLPVSWEDNFAAAVASVAHLLSPEFSIGLIGSSEPYNRLVLPWGSNPITDPLLSAGLMRIRHDGAGASRTDKVRSLATWPAAVENLRVCWQGEQLDRNCGQCEKCQRTLLNFELAGISSPACFRGSDTSPSLFILRGAGQIAEWRTLVDEANLAGRQDVVKRARRVLSRTRRRRLTSRLRPLRLARAVTKRLQRVS